MAMNNHRRVDAVCVQACERDLVESAGLAILIKFIGKTGFFKRCDDLLPLSEANSAYPPSTYVKTLFALCILYPDSNAPLERIDDIRASRAVRRILGVRKIPTAKSMGDWLRRMANTEVIGMSADDTPQYGGYLDGLSRMQELHCELAGKVLGDMKRVISNMLDFDACAIAGSKKCDVRMYTGERGTMSYLAFIDNICLMAELEPGNHAPADSIDKRVASCFEICRRQGFEILGFRSDSAAYVGKLMNECSRRSIKFYIRADNDDAVKRAYSTVDKWRKPKTDKLLPEPYELGTTVHCMATTKEAFSLVAKRQLVEKDASKQCCQCELEELGNTDYKYISIATNELVDDESEEAATAEMILATYNKRGNMENRIKQLVSDTQAGRLPTSDMDANRIYFYIMACLHNLMELFKYKCLDQSYQKLRLPSLIRILLRVPAVVVFHARRLYLRLPVYKKEAACIYQEVLMKISALKTMFAKNEKHPAFAEIIFRRE
jgi:Transposase DDE domain group 1